jgi:hypothetical protein
MLDDTLIFWEIASERKGLTTLKAVEKPKGGRTMKIAAILRRKEEEKKEVSVTHVNKHDICMYAPPPARA